MDMVWRTMTLLLLPLLAATVACTSPHHPSSGHAAAAVDSAAVADSLLRVKADSAVRALTPEQRAGMLLMPAMFTRHDAPTLRQLRHYALDIHAGGIVLLRGDTLSARIIADTLRSMGRADMILSIDAEWGLGMRLEDAPSYPVNGELSTYASEKLMRSYGSRVAQQCRRLGITMVLGPVVDVVPEGGQSIMSRRSFGADPARVARLASAYARALEEGGVISVAKHFPGHGSVPEDSHRTLPVLHKSLHLMMSQDLLPFRIYVEGGMSGIMVGHIAVPAVDPDIQPAAVSAAVITDLLRNDMKFRGLILTDALNMGGAEGAPAWKAVAAGADLVLAPADTDAARRDILAAIERGDLTQADVDGHCRRIFYYIYKLRSPHRCPNPSR